jgi:Ig-like domain CHU_C associated
MASRTKPCSADGNGILHILGSKYTIMVRSSFILAILVAFHFSATAQSFNISSSFPTDICFGSVTLQVDNPVAGYQYNWYVGSYHCDNATSVGASFPYAYGTSIQAYASGEFYCYGVPPGGGPWEISNNFINIRVLPGSVGSMLMPPPYSSSPVTCLSSVPLCIPTAFWQNFTTTIKWYRNNAIITGASSANYTATQSGWYKYSITSPCMTDYSDSVQVLIPSTLSTFSLSQPSPLCNFTNVTFTANNPVAGATYTWQVSQAGGTYLNVGTGSSFNYTVPSTTYINVRMVQVDNGCSRTTTAQTFQVTTLVASVTPSGTVSICSGSVALNATTNGTGIQWTKNGVDIPGATSSTYNVAATDPGVYAFRATGACNGYRTSNQVTVNQTSPSTPLVTATGPTTFCAGGSVTFNVAPTSGALFQWYKNSIAIQGATSSSLPVSASGSYYVQQTLSGGCVSNSNPVQVTINPLPSASIVANGATTFCAGGSVQLNANSGTGLSYQWKKNGINITGAVSNSYSATSTSTYKCMVTDLNGCSRASNSISVTVNPLPTATITALSNTQICQGDSVGLSASTNTGNIYQWKKYANIISGAILPVYYASTTGNFKCVVTNTFGCSRTSNIIGVNIVCREGLPIDEQDFSILYDEGSWIVNLQGSNEMESGCLMVFDLQGRKVSEFKIDMLHTRVQMETEIGTGLYVVQLLMGNQSLNKKIWIEKM